MQTTAIETVANSLPENEVISITFLISSRYILIAELHNIFDDLKVNKINGRKEFFHVKLSEIEKVISECGVSFKMVNEPYARDYRESIKCSNKMNKNSIEEDTKVGIVKNCLKNEKEIEEAFDGKVMNIQDFFENIESKVSEYYN